MQSASPDSILGGRVAYHGWYSSWLYSVTVNAWCRKPQNPSLSCLLHLFQILPESPLSVPCSINAAVDSQLPQSENQTDVRNVGSCMFLFLTSLFYDHRNLWRKCENKSYAGCINSVNWMLRLMSPNNFAGKLYSIYVRSNLTCDI